MLFFPVLLTRLYEEVPKSTPQLSRDVARFHLEVFMHLHLNCFFFFFFQGEHSSTIEKSYFCKRKKTVWKGWCKQPPLAQAVGDVNSQICPMVHKNFHKTVLLVCTTLGCVSLIHSFLYGKHTLVKTTNGIHAINTVLVLLSHIMSPY